MTTRKGLEATNEGIWRRKKKENETNGKKTENGELQITNEKDVKR